MAAGNVSAPDKSTAAQAGTTPKSSDPQPEPTRQQQERESTSTTLPGPDDILQQLKNQLEAKRADQERLTRENAALKDAITVLEKFSSELKQAGTSYGQAFVSIRKEKQDLDAYLDQTAAAREEPIEQEKPKINEIIHQYDQQVTEKERFSRIYQTEKTTAAESYKEAQEDLSMKQEAFDTWKNYTAFLSQKIGEAKKLKAEIDKDYEQNRLAKMYFLDLELKGLLKSAEPVSQDELRSKLTQAWSDLKTAKESVLAKKANLEQATERAETSQKELATLRSERKAKIVERVTELDKRAEGAPAAAD